jgi:hypothetical protein
MIARELDLELNPNDISLDHVKVDVHRDAVFVDGVNILTHSARSPPGDLVPRGGGTGFGPTHEFFTLFSHELCRSARRPFRTERPSSEFADAKCGMFFAPVEGAAALRTLRAKALQMNCLVGINVNPALFAFLRGKPVGVRRVDAPLGRRGGLAARPPPARRSRRSSSRAARGSA